MDVTQLRPFQIFMLALFGILAVTAVVLLSGFSGSATSQQDIYGPITIWGTLEERAVVSVLNEIKKTDKGFETVSYRQIDERTFDDTLVSAIAEGRAPQLVLLPSSELVQQRNRLWAIEEDARTYRDTYIDGAEIFFRPDGVYAQPLLVDPMVMYWNRDLFASAGLPQAPTTWEYIVGTVVPLLTKQDTNRTILQSALAFGEVRNVTNAKEILLTLTMQSGSRMIYEEREQYQVALNRSINESALPPLAATTNFYTSFSNANSALYSWNRSQPDDRNAFIAGDVAMYFGYGSENSLISQQNPNLNYDVTTVPQGAAASVKRTYGEFYGLAIPKVSSNPEGAYAVAQVLVSPTVSASLASQLGMASANRSALSVGSANPITASINAAALTARGWLDPDSSATEVIFQDMIENVSSGRESTAEAASNAERKIRLTF